MSASDVLHAMLKTDPRDVGCELVFEAIDAYVDLVVAGEDPELAHPGITAHLRSCPPCHTDFEGLLAAVRDLDADS